MTGGLACVSDLVCCAQRLVRMKTLLGNIKLSQELLPCDDKRYRVVTPRVMDILASQTDSGADLAYLAWVAHREGKGSGTLLAS